MRAFRHRDFRLFWIGAFLSFVGTWVQNVATGWVVFQMTNDESKLAFITFCGAIPVSLIGPFAGTLTDIFNKKIVLVIAQIVFALGAFYFLIAFHYGFIQYWHFIVVSLVLGFVSAIEMPTRQSLVSRVVPREDLGSAIPSAALTFNMARVAGPAIGGLLLAAYGANSCFFVNGVSYFALVYAVVAIRSNLQAHEREPQPILDLVLEGMRYTFRDRRLRTLFLLESILSVFGMFAMSLMPAITKKMMGLDARGLGFAMTSIGIGAIAALFTLASLKDRPIKALLIKVALTVVGVSLLLLGFTNSPWLGFPLLMLVGLGSVTQFNTTNTLFQLISPEHLRGRVLSMHVWALSGLSPIGLLFFGYVAKLIPHDIQTGTYGIQVALLSIPGFGPMNDMLAGTAVNDTGLPLALKIGGCGVLAGAIWSWLDRKGLNGVP